MGYAEQILTGDFRAAARLMRDIDDDIAGVEDQLRLLYPHTGRAFLIGVTGAPGVGKSTLTDVLIAEYRNRNLRVGVLAIDPTSPFTGGAILGDRIRMQRHALDKGVFVRSVANRGFLGGISRSTWGMVHVLDALGLDIIIIETVGVGQAEIEISRCVHCVLVVVAPGMGDEVQSLKAGIMEIGSIFVVNKAHREGAQKTLSVIQELIELDKRGDTEWTPLACLTEALKLVGIDELMAGIDSRQQFLNQDEGAQRQALTVAHARDEILQLARDTFFKENVAPLAESGELDEIALQTARRHVDPYSAARQIVRPRPWV